ncbi:MAG: shikimate dehydrogenase [Rhodobacteraceae bacterium]|nr:shikimate dehydrogenase [Paracoccaceae bacterium]
MKTLRCGLIGDHISQTRLSAALDLMCREHGIDLTFELIDTSEHTNFDFDRCVAGLRQKGWDGVTVTHPYKQAAADYAGDGLPSELRRLGASNTLVFGGNLTGFNTDYSGFLAAWAAQMSSLSVGVVALAGAGGVARALGPALIELGAREIRIFDTSADRARDLADRIGPCARVVLQDQWPDAIKSADGLVNATPLGMGYNPGTAFAADLIETQAWAFDAVYTPTDTQFLNDCSRAKVAILTGFDLFQHMAIRSFQAYTGVTPEPDVTLSKLATLRPD